MEVFERRTGGLGGSMKCEEKKMVVGGGIK